MCVVAIAWRAHPDYPLVVAGNRDELHARPASALYRRDDGLIAGQDFVSGGVWLGLTEAGAFGVVTNRRSDRPMDVEARSRGLLLRDLLLEPSRDALPGFDAYNPVNLGLIREGRAEIVSNWETVRRRPQTKGLFGLSNGDIDAPSSRAAALTGRLADWLAAPAGPEALFEALADQTPTEADPASSVFGAAPLFMHHPIYGTRCSTVIVVDRLGRGQAIERSFNDAGETVGEVSVAFSWPQDAG